VIEVPVIYVKLKRIEGIWRGEVIEWTRRSFNREQIRKLKLE
jgi:hypothetical protein